jgi:hypothetical protein
MELHLGARSTPIRGNSRSYSYKEYGVSNIGRALIGAKHAQ